MKLTEADPELSLRGYLVSALKIFPNDPRLTSMSHLELCYTVYWLRKAEEDYWERFGRTLGVIWHREDIDNMMKDEKNKTPTDTVFLPLSMVMQPNIVDALKKMFGNNRSKIGSGDYVPKAGEEIVELGDFDKETFKKLIGNVVIPTPINER